MKRTISLFLSILFIIYILPFSVSAFTVFTDTVKGSWYEESLNYCYDHGYIKGTAENSFSPAGSLTRAMTVQLFYSINDVAAPEALDSFTDVKQGHWFYDAVEWAYAEGIVSGTGMDRFSPQSNVTRQDFYVILYNYSRLFSHYDDIAVEDNYLYFDDNGDIADYAIEALNWAKHNGLLSGYKDNTLKPRSTMTRAEITSVIMRYDDILGHRWTVKKSKPRTCLEGGYTEYVCRDCPSAKRVEFPKGHIYYLYAQHNGTCISKGSYEYRCHNCTIIYSEATRYGDHSFVITSTVKPTRVKGGYSIYTCEYCGGTNHGDYTLPLGRTEGWDSNYDGKLTIDEYFGAYGIVDFLASHKNDYVGTPYVRLADYMNEPWKLMRDRGQYGNSAGMNCTGFVAAVINRSGGNLGRVSNTSGGSYGNAYNWYLTLNRNGIYHYTFGSIQAAIKSGKLKKGDIFLFLPENKDSDPGDGLDPDFHFGIFWGDYPTHDLFWHSTGATKYNYNYGVRGLKNQITRISSGTPYSAILVYPLSEDN